MTHKSRKRVQHCGRRDGIRCTFKRMCRHLRPAKSFQNKSMQACVHEYKLLKSTAASKQAHAVATSLPCMTRPHTLPAALARWTSKHPRLSSEHHQALH
jgi:hypothetical protein